MKRNGKPAMQYLWSYLPAIIVLSGAVVAAFGAFWSSYRQSNFNAAIREKNDKIVELSGKIIELQGEGIKTIKGSDFCRFFVASNVSYENGRLPLTVLNESKLPVYDVYIIVRSHVDTPFDTPENQKIALYYLQNPDRYELGTVPVGAKETNIFLDPGYYQIDIRTRYGKYTQMLRFGQFNGSTGQSYIVSDFHGNTLEKSTSPDGFPSVY